MRNVEFERRVASQPALSRIPKPRFMEGTTFRPTKPSNDVGELVENLSGRDKTLLCPSAGLRKSLPAMHWDGRTVSRRRKA